MSSRDEITPVRRLVAPARRRRSRARAVRETRRTNASFRVARAKRSVETMARARV